MRSRCKAASLNCCRRPRQASTGSALLRSCARDRRARRACDSRAIDVVSDEMALAMPKSINFRRPSTTRKLAGLRSLCTMRASWIACTACPRRCAASVVQQAPNRRPTLRSRSLSTPPATQPPISDPASTAACMTQALAARSLPASALTAGRAGERPRGQRGAVRVRVGQGPRAPAASAASTGG